MAIKFRCPKCGKTRLGSVEQVQMTYPIASIPETMVIWDTIGEPIVEEGCHVAFRCTNCGFELKDEQGNTIECVKVPEWCKKNCLQE